MTERDGAPPARHRPSTLAVHAGERQAMPRRPAAVPVVPGIGYAPDLTKEALAKPVGFMGGPTAVAGSAVMYQVATKKGVDPAVFAQQKETLRKQMEQEQVNALLASLINERKQELGVTFDPQLAKTIQGQQQG